MKSTRSILNGVICVLAASSVADQCAAFPLGPTQQQQLHRPSMAQSSRLPTPSTASATSTTIHLHPNQAKDLEACAYDLMRQALAQQQEQQRQQQQQGALDDMGNTMHKGPLRWCRHHITSLLSATRHN